VNAESHDRVVQRSFARQTHLFSGPDSPFASRPAGTLAWIEPVGSDMTVLDVASGAGHASEPVAPHVRRVIALDLTRPLLELGAERLGQAGIGNVFALQGSAEVLPFPSGAFDIAFCRASLHHFAQPTRAVSEMVRVTRPGGRIVLADLVAPDAELRDRFDHVHRLLDPSHVRAFLEPELAELVPGGMEALAYADTATLRFPVEVVYSDLSERDEVAALLRADARGEGPPTGLDPVETPEGTIEVSFLMCVLHGNVR
jgi:ubiquinone/menaquinone biosynthesis C-methylase UbiE